MTIPGDRQVIYPVERLLANPRVFMAIGNYFDGPEWEVWAGAFYDLIEMSVMEGLPDEIEFDAGECCFREDPDDNTIFQVILDNGNAMELKPTGDGYAAVESEDDLAIVSAIHQRILKALGEAKPEFQDNIALVEMPMPSNGYLRDEDGDAFRGEFHLLDDPDKTFGFVVQIIDMEKDELTATITAK